MSLILCYCEKCGQITAISNKELDNIKKEKCVSCDNIGYYKVVPQEYLTGGGLGIKAELNDRFIESVVKSSPNFDQECWDRREAFKEIQKHNDELLENDKIKQTNQPKCPTCGSTNIQKITGLERGISVATLGLFSKKINKSFKCNHCGYTW